MNHRRLRGGFVALLAAVVGALSVAGPAASSPRRCANGYVGLTFDDGPSATSPQLLAALRANHLRATMFNQGDNAVARPQYVRDEQRAGMWVGNHSFTHPNLRKLGKAHAWQEIARTQRALRDITHRTPTLLRPPYGATSDRVRADEKRLGLLEVLWTVNSRDWAGATRKEIVKAAATLQPGGIILMHDRPRATIKAIPGIARVLRTKGLCPGRIAYTPRAIPALGTTFHAIAVAP